MRHLALPAALALLALAGTAQAHARLVSASPAPNAVGARPDRVALRFSEALMPKFSGADLMMTGPAGKTGAAVKIAAVAAIGTDRRTLVLTPKSPLRAGRYTVAWHAVSTDTHRVTGSFAFTVR